MDTKNLCLFVFDTKTNFEKSKSNLGSEGYSFKKIICVEDAIEFEKEFNALADNELVFMVVHVFYTDKISGVKRFFASQIHKMYPQLCYKYISEGDSKQINKMMIDDDINGEQVYKYHQVQSNLEEEKFHAYSKKTILDFRLGNQNLRHNYKEKGGQYYPDCDYVIITALEEDEMEKVLPMLTKIGKVENSKHLIEYGHLKSNPSKTIAYASQLATGMIDAAILATELILIFKPKFLIMTGVLGGKPGTTNIGDIIIGTKVFTIDKGKLSDLGFKIELESVNNDGAHISSIRRNKKAIISHINESDPTRSKNIDVHFGSITCVRQVIDLEGYFEGKIDDIDRKAIALEMESYGIARACEIVNENRTTALIIKSVMDTAQNKSDEAKPYAAWTSAMLVKYILEHDLI